MVWVLYGWGLFRISLPIVPAAVYEEGFSGDEVAGGGGEKDAGADTLFHPSDAAYLDVRTLFSP